jgi:hypothetical protein
MARSPLLSPALWGGWALFAGAHEGESPRGWDWDCPELPFRYDRDVVHQSSRVVFVALIRLPSAEDRRLPTTGGPDRRDWENLGGHRTIGASLERRPKPRSTLGKRNLASLKNHMGLNA